MQQYNFKNFKNHSLSYINNIELKTNKQILILNK